jgi:hypothetical protein
MNFDMPFHHYASVPLGSGNALYLYENCGYKFQKLESADDDSSECNGKPIPFNKNKQLRKKHAIPQSPSANIKAHL